MPAPCNCLSDKLTLKAFGLIATRMPDGSPGLLAHRFHHRGGLPRYPARFGFNLLAWRHGRDPPYFDVDVLRED